MCNALKKVIEYLEANNFNFEDHSDEVINRIRVYMPKRTISIIHGLGTFGGIDPIRQYDNNLLEVFTWNPDDPENDIDDNPVGNLTAEEVINKYFREEN